MMMTKLRDSFKNSTAAKLGFAALLSAMPIAAANADDANTAQAPIQCEIVDFAGATASTAAEKINGLAFAFNHYGDAEGVKALAEMALNRYYNNPGVATACFIDKKGEPNHPITTVAYNAKGLRIGNETEVQKIRDQVKNKEENFFDNASTHALIARNLLALNAK